MAEEWIVEQRAGARLVESDVSQYPDSDGLPMAENDEHCRAILSIRGPLEVRFHGSADTYVTGDLLLYYKEGERKSVAPDVMVVRGVPTGPRRTYLLWEEGKPPDFVAEVSSPSSRSYDRTSKRALYAKLGVREYFLFDPVYEEPGHDGALQGYRLWGSESVEMGPGGGAELRSEVLGLSLRPEGKRVRLRDLATGQDLLWFEESENALRAAEDALRALERQRDEEVGARRAAEARVAELEALLRASNRGLYSYLTAGLPVFPLALIGLGFRGGLRNRARAMRSGSFTTGGMTGFMGSAFPWLAIRGSGPVRESLALRTPASPCATPAAL